MAKGKIPYGVYDWLLRTGKVYDDRVTDIIFNFAKNR